MLTKLRKYGFLKIFLWLVIISFLSTIFVVWGMGDNQKNYNYVAVVGNKTITENDYRNIEARAGQLRAYFDSNVDMEFIKSMLLSDLINNKLLLIEAERLGIIATDAEIINIVTQISAFYDENNKFNHSIYEHELKRQGLTPSQFEFSLREEILTKKMRDMIEGSVDVLENEIENEYIFRNTSVSLSYFALNTGKYKALQTYSPDELEAYYTVKKEDYRIPAQVKVKVLKFNSDDFKYESPVTDEVVREVYNTSLGSFTVPETVDLSHIVVFIDDWANESKVKAAKDKLSKALAELGKGAKFEAVAAKYSEDPDIVTNKGHLGMIEVPDGDVSPEEEQVFSLEKGKYSGIITTGYGMEIFKINSRTPAHVKPFSEVKDSIRSSMEQESYAGAYRNFIYNIYRDILKSGNITAYAEKNPGVFKIYETPYLFEDDPDAFFQEDDALKKAVFSLGKTDITQLTDLEDGTYLFEIIDRKNSYIPPFSEVEQDVAENYSKEKAFTTALSDVNAKITKTNTTAPEFNEYAKNLGVKVENMQSFTRSEPNPKEVWAKHFEAEIFSASTGDIIKYPVEEKSVIYVVRVNDKKIPVVKELSTEERDVIAEYIISLKKSDANVSYLTRLRNSTKIDINPNYKGQIE